MDKIKGSIPGFLEGSRFRQKTPEEDRMIYQAKLCEFNDEDNSPNTLSD